MARAYYHQYKAPPPPKPTPPAGTPSWMQYYFQGPYAMGGGQGGMAQPGAAQAKAEAEAIRKRYSYYQTQKSEATLRDERLRKYFARYLGPGNIMEKGPMAALEGVSQGITNVAVSANEAFKEAVIPGYQSPATKQKKALLARYKKAGGTGYYAQPTAPAPTAPTTTGMLPSYLERFFAGAGPYGPPQPVETTPAPATGYDYGTGYGEVGTAIPTTAAGADRQTSISTLATAVELSNE